MKKLILFLSFLVLPFLSFSQDTKKPKYTILSKNYYKVEYNSSNLTQSGYFLIKDKKALKHGTWVMKNQGLKKFKGLYEMGELQYLIVYTNGRAEKYTKHEIEIGKLRARMARLESSLADNN